MPAKTAPKKATKKKAAAKPAPKKTPEKKEAAKAGSIVWIDPRDILSCENPRYPLSDELRKEGFGCLGTFPHDTLCQPMKDLWRMASSEDQDDRTTFIQIIDDCDDSIRILGQTIITVGQLQPIGVTQAKDGKYILNFGQRRCLGVFYNYLKGLSSKCLVKAEVVKLNENDRFASAVVENSARKRMNPLEEGRAFLRMKNTGMSETEISAEQGVSESTVKNRIRLTTLDPKIQAKIESGQINPSDAIEASRKKRDSSKNGDGSGDGDGSGSGEGSGSSKECFKLRKKAEIIERLKEVEKDLGDGRDEGLESQISTLSWVLSVND